MKLCILSMQRVQNFGSLLQAYALLRMLEQCGHAVSFLDIEKRNEDDLKRNNKSHTLEKHKCGFFIKLKKLDRYAVNRLRIKALSQKQVEEFEDFRHEVLGIGENVNECQFDCCVIGSDEVFNCMSSTPWGFTSQLFGNVRQTDRVITYAASCGATTYEELTPALEAKIRESFDRVAAFSVRDENTFRFVSRLTNKIVKEHLDPVLVYDFEQELNETALPDDLPERYCVVYSYYNRISNPTEIDAIQKFCREHNLEIIAVGAPQMWIKKYVVLDPFQMLKVFQNASFVITDTFHGTIFSAKFATRFATMTRPSNENKLGDLIKKLHLEQHQIRSMDQLEKVFACMHNPEDTVTVGKKECERSIEYLKENIR